jgi:hypothetical protein
MALNFNVDPYFDDFNPQKNFHRILFKPGFAVQARELTQAQSILQNQITSFADAIFAQNTPISGGKVTVNQNVYFLKLNTNDNSGNAIVASDYLNGIINSADGSIVAKVLATVESTTTSAGGEGDPPTLIVSYISGDKFSSANDVYLQSSNLIASIITESTGNPATGLSSVASISQGIFYVDGNFVVVNEQTIVLSKYDSTPSIRIGLNSIETIVDAVDDSSLLDPAFNATNYQAPGADRYKISLELQTRPLELGNDDSFIELVRIVDGSIVKQVNNTVYSVIDDYFAKRTSDTNGDFIVNDYTLTPKSNTINGDLYNLSISKGISYVRGYRLENQADVTLTNDRARTISTVTNNPTFIDYGNYFYVNSSNGVFDVTTSPQIDFHTVNKPNIVTTNQASYNSTRAATAYIRNMIYDSTSNTANGLAYVYKAYVYNIQNQTLSANAAGSSANNTYIQLPTTNQFSNIANAYTGVTISIDRGTSAGDFRTITGYDAVSKIAYVNTPFTISPTTSSQFTLRFDVSDFESMIRSTAGTPYTITANAAISDLNKVNNVSSGDVVIQDPNNPELLFTIGNPYVSFANNSSYTTTQVFRNVAFNDTGENIVAQLAFGSAPTSTLRFLGNGPLSTDAVAQNFQIVVTDPQASGLSAGQIIPWSIGSRTCSISGSGGTATFTTSDTDLGAFTATIIAKAFVSNGNNNQFILKSKNLVEGNMAVANTTGTTVETYTKVSLSDGQVYIANTGIVVPGQPQKLYITDVKRIVKIIDTKSGATPATVDMLTNPIYDVTSRFTFDNGQRDSYYDFAAITLRIGQPKIQGNLLVVLDYYSTTGGDGYYSVMSYLSPISSSPENYPEIPSYLATNGNFYELKDSIDFRPSLINAQSSFTIRTSNSGSGAAGAYIPVDLTEFESDYGYYLGRYDKLVLSKDRSFEIVQGAPSQEPIEPIEPDGSLVIANLYHDPYTAYIPGEITGILPNLSIERVKHKRWLMSDITGLENRVNNIEYYTTLNLLETGAASLQIADGNGLNRFKNGILVDDFSSYATADTGLTDFYVCINRRTKQMTAAQEVQNFPLQSLSLAYNMGQLDSTTANNLGFKISTSSFSNFFTLPYTTANVVTQRIASRTVNLNPFLVALNQGVVTLSPPMDNFVDTQRSPDLLIVDPNLQVYRASNNVNVLQVGDWKTTSSATTTTAVRTGKPNPGGGLQQVNTVTTVAQQTQTVVKGNYDKLNSSYVETAGFITDVSVLPYIREQFLVFNAHGMTVNTEVNYYFDNQPINNYVRKPNILELDNVSGSFTDGEMIGFVISGTFRPAGRIVSWYRYPNDTTKVRVYTAGDVDARGNPYIVGQTIRNAKFNQTGQYQNSTASGRIVSFVNYGGQLANVISTTSVTLSPMAANTDIYTGNTLYVISGTGKGQSSTIISYNSTTKRANLSSAITAKTKDVYSIGNHRTNETGMISGIFAVPGGTFSTGQRTFRVDNSVGGNIDSATSVAEASFYASGLQQTKQGLNFASSIDSAKNTFTQTNQRTNVTSYSYITPWDPVAQTFIIDKENYPNGIFIDSIKLFFKTKPTAYAPVELSIVGTLNGYPNGETLDNSQVFLTNENIKLSDNPHYLDPNTYTVFKFPAPVYLESNKLYAFIAKCPTSNEYTIYTAQNGDQAIASSVKNLPSDPTPKTITKISTAPYIGNLFLSQNSQTWTADQNESMMFTIDRCVFSVGTQPTVQFVVPNKLPYRKLTEDSVAYFLDPNTITSSASSFANTDVLVNAFNVSTTDFVPGGTILNYSYSASLNSDKSLTTATNITPGKYGTPTYDEIYLSDGLGERVLIANSNTSFLLNATLTTIDDAVSPMISDDGLGVYTINWAINNLELSNNIITVANGGSGYNVNTTSVTITSNTGSGAVAVANVTNGVITDIYITNGGSGYATTPFITVVDANSSPGTGASITVGGETSASGGNAAARYITKKVVLQQGFDSGDIRVYFTAYRPVNTNIYVYYKVLSRSDTQTFDSGNWQLMTLINNSGSLYSQTRDNTFEFVAAPGTGGIAQNYVEYTSNESNQTYNNFNQFQIKIVLATSDKTAVPFLTDIRAIALPSGV